MQAAGWHALSLRRAWGSNHALRRLRACHPKDNSLHYFVTTYKRLESFVLVFHENVLKRSTCQRFISTCNDEVRELAGIAEIAVARPLSRVLAAQVLAEHVRGSHRHFIFLPMPPQR